MKSSAGTVLLFGDVTDDFVEGIDFIYKQSEHHSWIRSFLADIAAAIKDEIKVWEVDLRESLGRFQSIQDLNYKARYERDDIGIAHGLLVFVMRQSLLLQSVIPSHLLCVLHLLD